MHYSNHYNSLLLVEEVWVYDFICGGNLLLPDKFALNRKQGFSIPLNQWLQKGEWLEYFKSILLDTGSIYKESVVNRLIKANQKGYYNSERLFSLVIFELWRRKYNVSF